MARKRRRKELATTSASSGWQWLTFPVFAAFAFGAAAVILVQIFIPGALGYQITFLGAVGMLSFVFAHILTHFMRKIMIRQRTERMQAAQRQQGSGQRPAPPAQ